MNQLNVEYYQQEPIMHRILEHVEDSVYVLGTEPYESHLQFRRPADIMNATASGSDIHRSQLDFGGVNFFIDVEYANRAFPGEMFHKPAESFEKIEGLRRSIKDHLERQGLPHLELMTGQGYNYTSKIRRDSPSYEALEELGQHLRVLPWSAAKTLMEQEQRHGNIPLHRDSFVFGALGRILDHVYEEVGANYSDLPLTASDTHPSDETAIFDTTQHGYLLYNRRNRIAFSLNQKSIKNPVYEYHGPPIPSITPQGLPLESRLEIRGDVSDNYRKTAGLASEVETRIPEVDVSHLLSSYLLSDTFSRNRDERHHFPTKPLAEDEIAMVKTHYPDMEPEQMFWDVPREPDWQLINSAPISHHARRTIDHPNDSMLRPHDLQHLILELQEHEVPLAQITSLIAFKYSEPHGWIKDLTQNDPVHRAGYWVRTLAEH